MPAHEIAAAIGAGLGLAVVSVSAGEAPAHYGWLGAFVGLDMPASSVWTRERLGWAPEGPRLIADLQAMDYRRSLAAA